MARVGLSRNPWDSAAFQVQICAIILGPTVVCVPLYLTLKHVALAVGGYHGGGGGGGRPSPSSPSLVSRVRPALYPLVFVPADVSCLVLQAAGGGLAVGARWTNARMLDAGNRLIIAGIALQCVVLAAFGLLCLEYFCRVRAMARARARDQATATATATAAAGAWALGGVPGPATCAVWDDGRFRLFCYALLGAYVGILLRCLYR